MKSVWQGSALALAPGNANKEESFPFKILCAKNGAAELLRSRALDHHTELLEVRPFARTHGVGFAVGLL